MKTTKTNARFEFVSRWGIFFKNFLRGFGGGVYLLVPFFVLVGGGGGDFCLPTSYSLFFCMGVFSPL